MTEHEFFKVCVNVNWILAEVTGSQCVGVIYGRVATCLCNQYLLSWYYHRSEAIASSFVVLPI